MTVARSLKRWPVGTADEFPMGEFRVLDLGGRPVGVVKTDQGFYAVRNRCPHQGADICSGTVGGTMVGAAPFEYDYREDVLVVACPWHRWEFALDSGESFGRITNKRLVTYPVEVEDGQVYVMMKGGRGT